MKKKFVIEVTNKAEADFIIQLGKENGYEEHFDNCRSYLNPGKPSYISFNTLSQNEMAYNPTRKLYDDMGVEIVPFSEMGRIKELIKENEIKVNDWVTCIISPQQEKSSGTGWERNLCFRVTEIKLSTFSEDICYMGGEGGHGVYKGFVRKATQKEISKVFKELDWVCFDGVAKPEYQTSFWKPGKICQVYHVQGDYLYIKGGGSNDVSNFRKATEYEIYNTVQDVGQFTPEFNDDGDVVTIGRREFHKDFWNCMKAIASNAEGHKQSMLFRVNGSITIDGATCSARNVRAINKRLNGNA